MLAITLRKPIRATTYFILLAMLLLVLNIGMTLALQDNEQLRLVIMDLMSPAINLLATAALIIAAVNSAKYSRRMAVAWGVIALAQLLFTLGDIAWAVIEVGFGEAPFPSSADWFYLAYYPLLLTGILLLPGQKPGTFAWIKKGLDMGIAMISAILLFWNFLIGPLIQAGAQEPMLTQVLSMAYPVGDLLLMFALLVLLYNRPSFADTMPIALLTIGTINMVATDSIFSYQSLMGTYVSGGLLDIGWIVGYLFTGLAGVWLAYNPYAGGTKPAKVSDELERRRHLAGIAHLPALSVGSRRAGPAAGSPSIPVGNEFPGDRHRRWGSGCIDHCPSNYCLPGTQAAAQSFESGIGDGATAGGRTQRNQRSAANRDHRAEKGRGTIVL